MDAFLNNHQSSAQKRFLPHNIGSKYHYRQAIVLFIKKICLEIIPPPFENAASKIDKLREWRVVIKQQRTQFIGVVGNLGFTGMLSSHSHKYQCKFVLLREAYLRNVHDDD
uniref:Uncharacterized protein n=1 Tax=Schistocephalus solidus TaxID=70667 RepID=A0A0V0J4R4_SCHSO